ncbi:MarR family winged helix-turn-helix transcriptional regulator [Novosphingobium barchaimii]|uniref:MarR family winged helix-turn-helix transcriptional regulator n=1 Tax=Novosphingobium barchaimii TaxID=1420591 RepID=UPI0011DFE19D|nr:MarR family winged helix-turn-helix transcriptional regulator [Novosphingobium barchaimii]
MLKIEELRDELHTALGDHARIECEIDNVQVYLDAIAVRRRVAPEVEECGWLMLLDLYRNHGRGSITVSRACAASTYPTTTAIDHVSKLSRKGLVAYVKDSADQRRVYLVLTQQGINVISEWLALMHLEARRQVEVTAGSIVSALRTLPRHTPS